MLLRQSISPYMIKLIIHIFPLPSAWYAINNSVIRRTSKEREKEKKKEQVKDLSQHRQSSSLFLQ